MTEANDARETRGIGRATMSVEGRRLIGQAIIDGVLNPDNAFSGMLADYDQHGGNYTQVGGGNYTQYGGGNYTQVARTQRAEVSQ